MSRWFSLDALSGCRIEGPDAVAFCQSQFTADMAAMVPERWQAMAWCDRKGRVRIVSLARRDQDDVELIFPAQQADLLQELARYTIGRKVSVGPPQPVAGNWSDAHGTPITGDRFGRVLQLCRDCEGDPAQPTRDIIDRWARQDILLPLPWLDGRSQDRFLPQALGLEDNGGLSYTKGCYPGQEIVARVHYLGRSPERLSGIRFEAPAELTEGALLRAGASTPDGRPVTILALSRRDRDWIGLAVVPNRDEPTDRLQLDLDGRQLRAYVTSIESLC
jgi:folate-binding protein YgfZ